MWVYLLIPTYVTLLYFSYESIRENIIILGATCFFRVILLDRHRPLSTHETKLHRLNSSTFSLNEPFHFNILAFNSTNRNRLMIMINLYSNANNTNEHRCIARVKLASPHICSGTGTIHWQQFNERQSFSMWHTLIKQYKNE